MTKSLYELTTHAFPMKIMSVSQKIKKCPTTIKEKLRINAWKGKYKGECFSCGRQISWENVEGGRIKAGANGGDYTLPNTRLICKFCNRGMGKTNMRIYMKKNHPERYQKYFKIEGIEKPKKKKNTNKSNQSDIFKIPKIKIPKFF